MGPSPSLLWLKPCWKCLGHGNKISDTSGLLSYVGGGVFFVACRIMNRYTYIINTLLTPISMEKKQREAQRNTVCCIIHCKYYNACTVVTVEDLLWCTEVDICFLLGSQDRVGAEVARTGCHCWLSDVLDY